MLAGRAASVRRAAPVQRAFGVLVVITGMALMLSPAGVAGSPTAVGAGVASAWALVVLVGLLTGALSGLVGVGGGSLTVPALVFLLGLPQKLAQGTSLAVLIPVALSGGLIHTLRGNVIAGLAGWLACGGAVGAFVVSHFVGRLADETIKMAFGIFLIAVGVWMTTRRRPAEETTH
jgi:uncharacterized membrane protein YfcA